MILDDICPLCWAMGEVIREDKSGRLYPWPCPLECESARMTLIKIHSLRGLQKKANKR